MAQRTGGAYHVLASAGVYSVVQRVLGAEHVRRAFIRDHLRPRSCERILDLGCGPGDILELLPEVEYVGIDSSATYITAAQQRFGDRSKFICADVRGLSADRLGTFDAVVSIGLLHHLDDAAAGGTGQLAAEVLVPDGRLVTIDPGLAEGQPRVARWLIARDRGQSVRTPDAYHHLLGTHFGKVSATVKHDLARVPYTHVILEARDPRAPSTTRSD